MVLSRIAFGVLEEVYDLAPPGIIDGQPVGHAIYHDSPRGHHPVPFVTLTNSVGDLDGVALGEEFGRDELPSAPDRFGIIEDEREDRFLQRSKVWPTRAVVVQSGERFADSSRRFFFLFVLRRLSILLYTREAKIG